MAEWALKSLTKLLGRSRRMHSGSDTRARCTLYWASNAKSSPPARRSDTAVSEEISIAHLIRHFHRLAA